MRTAHAASKHLIIIAMSLLLISGLVPAVTMASGTQQMSGAIWTTDRNGRQVNGNLFSKGKDVYLVGGPFKKGGSGFDDGIYYFQVTDSSGKQLLSKDEASDRWFEVSDGAIVASGHALSSADVVQLWPFDASANGEYKVWVTADPTGFTPANSKTDNFKVLKPPDAKEEASKSFQLWVTDAVFDLTTGLYVYYQVEGETQWTQGQLLQDPDADGTSLTVFRYDATFTLGTKILWYFEVTYEGGSWTSEIPTTAEEITHDGMVNAETLVAITGSKYNNKPTDPPPLAGLAGHPIELSDGQSTATGPDGGYVFIGAVGSDYRVTALSIGTFGTMWEEFTVDTAEDQRYDFYVYALSMLGLDGAPYFDLVFTPSNDGDDLYKLSSTNPGSFHFNVERIGTPDVPVSVSISLPEADGFNAPNFIFQHSYIGSALELDIHVYDGATGEDITADFTIDPIDLKHAVISGDYPSSGQLRVTAHLDFQLTGPLTQEQVDYFEQGVTYYFEVEIEGTHFWGRSHFIGR